MPRIISFFLDVTTAVNNAKSEIVLMPRIISFFLDIREVITDKQQYITC